MQLRIDCHGTTVHAAPSRVCASAHLPHVRSSPAARARVEAFDRQVFDNARTTRADLHPASSLQQRSSPNPMLLEATRTSPTHGARSTLLGGLHGIAACMLLGLFLLIAGC
jgi:hypothetical protein